jgi:hypothetical protein
MRRWEIYFLLMMVHRYATDIGRGRSDVGRNMAGFSEEATKD